VRSKRRNWKVLSGLLVVALLGLWIFCGWLTVAVATAPRRKPVQPVATIGGVAVEDVEVTTLDGLRVSGWLGRVSGARVVIIFAGKGGDRSTNLGVADYYASRGWSVLLPDLRATGESDGERVAMGYAERLDVRAWIEFAQEQHFGSIALHGQSLGAAAITYAFDPDCKDFQFVVLEGCYDDVRHALFNRLDFVPFPELTLKPVEWFGALAVGVPLDELRPIDRLASYRSPVLFIAGDADPHALPSETQRIFDACGAATKQLSWIEGGVHEHLWARDEAAYVAALERFFGELGAIAAAKNQW
jgi:uncharacterized protein